jgi:hypothetical protein
VCTCTFFASVRAGAFVRAGVEAQVNLAVRQAGERVQAGLESRLAALQHHIHIGLKGGRGGRVDEDGLRRRGRLGHLAEGTLTQERQQAGLLQEAQQRIAAERGYLLRLVARVALDLFLGIHLDDDALQRAARPVDDRLDRAAGG